MILGIPSAVWLFYYLKNRKSANDSTNAKIKQDTFFISLLGKIPDHPSYKILGKLEGYIQLTEFDIEALYDMNYQSLKDIQVKDKLNIKLILKYIIKEINQFALIKINNSYIIYDENTDNLQKIMLEQRKEFMKNLN